MENCVYVGISLSLPNRGSRSVFLWLTRNIHSYMHAYIHTHIVAACCSVYWNVCTISLSLESGCRKHVYWNTTDLISFGMWIEYGTHSHTHISTHIYLVYLLSILLSFSLFRCPPSISFCLSFFYCVVYTILCISSCSELHVTRLGVLSKACHNIVWGWQTFCRKLLITRTEHCVSHINRHIHSDTQTHFIQIHNKQKGSDGLY